jgi:thioredoxin-related protein
VTRLILATVIVVCAVVLAQWVQARRRTDPPTQPRRHVPTQLDRTDFSHPDRPWLLVVFTSELCSVCADVSSKARVLDSEQVTVATIGFEDRADLHQRYQIDSVPTLVIADAEGVVRYGIVGPISATDLWAAMARVRDPETELPDGGCQAPGEDRPPK